jgi:adenine phosphoribosyltransferase
MTDAASTPGPHDHLKDKIRTVMDFPKPGIGFKDITTLVKDPAAFKYVTDVLAERYKDKKIDAVAGMESRGFIFGAPLAIALGAAFIPLRKPNKLPSKVITQTYDLEYGTDCLCMHEDAVEKGWRVLILDDLIATGGTMGAALGLIKQAEAEVVECAVVIELSFLPGREKLGGVPLYSMVTF